MYRGQDADPSRSAAVDETIAAVLSSWYADNARDLPWRRPGTSAWAVLVSEVMLQQTPVARVVPVWTTWMQRWADAATLAEVSAADVIRAWGKLGYPRRALRLHDCAQALVEHYGGVVPADVDELLGLPGIGTYTARAVAAFAFGQRHPVVDVNVRRVVARAVLGQAQPAGASARRDMAAVDALLPANDAAAARASIAFMELGALVCTAAKPACSSCPLYGRCAWRLAGAPMHAGHAVPAPRRQRFAGTDRQVRGLLLDVLRSATAPVDRSVLDVVWALPEQRGRALDSLLADGLVIAVANERFALPGTPPAAAFAG